MMVAAGREVNNGTHDFPAAREGDRLDDLGQVVGILPALPTENFGKLKKGSFGLGPNKSELFGLWVLEGGGVDHN